MLKPQNIAITREKKQEALPSKAKTVATQTLTQQQINKIRPVVLSWAHGLIGALLALAVVALLVTSGSFTATNLVPIAFVENLCRLAPTKGYA